MEGELVGAALLISWMSYDANRLKQDVVPSTVKAMHCRTPTPDDARHSTDESDCHVVPITIVTPT